jgi:hypothetical protein
MVEGNAPALDLDPETRRALQLDALAAILPMDRRDRLAELLTDDDVETLKHLAREGMGENSLRALASDLAYLETWADAATGQPLPWPATEALTLKFVAHHLWDPSKREIDPRHGMPADVAEGLRTKGLLRCDGPHAPSTVKRRLASWSTLHRWKGSRDRSPRRACAPPALGRSCLAAAARAQEQAGRHPGRLGSVDRNLRDGSFSRYPGGISPSSSWRLRPAGVGAAKWRGCASSS